MLEAGPERDPTRAKTPPRPESAVGCGGDPDLLAIGDLAAIALVVAVHPIANRSGKAPTFRAPR